jgi:diguanylate cyclase (GGDEF)-like protein
MWNKIYRDGNWSGDIWNRRKNGNYYLEWLSITSIIDKHGKTTHYIGTFSDITYRKQAEQQVQIMAHYDTLTNLPNRILLNERLKHSIVRATRHNQWISVLSLNLDRFKTLNETLGHFIGDLLLQGVAQRLSECVGVSDTVARFGGDEFVIILSDFEDEQAAILHTKEIANHILSELVKPFDLLGNKFLTSTSIGFAFFPKHGRSVAELLKNSDNAMYFAKAMGRNNYQCYSGNMRVQAMTRSCLANDLRLVLENRELVLYFQSIVNLHTLETVGFEVLVRWNHPKRGLLMPDQFIPIAEETGMINEIGRWALHTACQQLTVWHNAGKRVKIAVNLSAQQFFQHDLFTTIIDALESHNVPSEYLELDITEAIIMQNLNQAMRILKKLQQLGVKISLDDFGTGYSSLTYLKRLPINAIKIDRSFVKKLLNESRDQVIVDSIISIAEHMQLDIITEGIEQIEQVEYFKSKGIKFAQGYYFALPCIADECFLTNDKNNQHF